MNDSVQVQALRKVFPRRARRGLLLARDAGGSALIAVNGVDFSVGRGEVFGLLGPNGAGKTTTIKILCTLLTPTSGTAQVAGFDVIREPAKVRAALGTVMSGERSVYWKLTGRENLAYFAALNRLPAASAREQIQRLLDRMGLTARADELVERYSSGMKQRLALARALLASPPILLLDEPTVGLDPQAARSLRELIQSLRSDGHTVLLTTHYMAEADELCDRVAIIDQGRIIALDAPAALKASLDTKDAVRLEVSAGADGLLAGLMALDGVEAATARPMMNGSGAGTSEVHVIAASHRQAVGPILETVRAAGLEILNFQVVEPTLEDVFIHLTGKSLREG